MLKVVVISHRKTTTTIVTITIYIFPYSQNCNIILGKKFSLHGVGHIYITKHVASFQGSLQQTKQNETINV